jgi:basic membrane protein A and related proteins
MRAKRIAVLALALLAAVFGAYAEGTKEAAKPKLRVAAVFPGSIQDADYNALGYLALEQAKKTLGAETAFSEKVAVPDAERVMKEYANEGFNIIWVHGNQFNSAALKIGPDYPNVTFIIEGDGKPDKPLANFWYIDRNYYTGFYTLGYLAALQTKAGKIGYVAGLELPFTRGEINAVKQAIRDSGVKTSFEHIYVGDFNDPVKARQAAEGLIAKGVDVIISAVNLGNLGIYAAVKDAGRPVWITTTYTSKKTEAPANYLTSDIFDFNVTLGQILDRTAKGEKGGFLVMEYGDGKARTTEMPIANTTSDINEKVKAVAADVASGKRSVVKNLDAILP